MARCFVFSSQNFFFFFFFLFDFSTLHANGLGPHRMLVFLSLVSITFAWQMQQRELHHSEPLSFHIALKHNPRAVSRLQARVNAIINPLNPQPRMTKKEVRMMMAHPSNKMVEGFLRRSCPGAVIKNRGDSILVHGTVGCAKALFPAARLAPFIHGETGAFAIALSRSDSRLVIPKEISEYVDLVVGISGPDALYVPRTGRIVRPQVTKHARGDNIT